MRTRVVVTGLGVVSPIGVGKNVFWKNLIKGRSGISKLSVFDTKLSRTHVAGEIKNPILTKEHPKKRRTTRFLLKAVTLAERDSKIDLSSYDPLQVSMITGSGKVDIRFVEEMNEKKIVTGRRRINPEDLFSVITKNPPIIVARKLGIGGINLAIATACSAGNYAIGYGLDLLRQGKSKVVFCSGVDVLIQSMFEGFNRLFATTTDKIRPFDKNRSGTTLGEGAATLILERLDDALARGARIYAEVLGYGLSCDAFSLTIPSKDGMKKVMERAIRNSGIKVEDIDHINCHGTGTVNNDKFEALAIREIFKERADKIYATAIKSMLGHTVGAASIIEAASCCLSIRDGIIPPTINYETPDPECNLRIVANKAKKAKVSVVMNNSFAFGGNNACVIFRKPEKSWNK
ncbi:MAG: beta-ketoacyl-[acyl-carrier-protein] synthase family protein [Candidatus Aadella gelida]|nr:beta-ketoacyl-[acyl-carrier-protein] synthase family protein [Candidatus Aadella gelida]